jgi:hypothetical protein
VDIFGMLRQTTLQQKKEKEVAENAAVGIRSLMKKLIEDYWIGTLKELVIILTQSQK